MSHNSIFTILTLLTISACQSQSIAYVQSGASNMTSDGELTTTAFGKIVDSEMKCTDRTACTAWQIGTSDKSTRFLAYSGYRVDPGNPNSDIAPSTLTTYNSTYSLGGVKIGGDAVRRESDYFQDSGTIELTFDPNRDRITGNDEDYLVVKADVDETDFSGTIESTYFDGEGKIEGHINYLQLYGAFNGHDEKNAIAGYIRGIDESGI